MRALCICLIGLVAVQMGFAQDPTNPCKKYSQDFGLGWCTAKYTSSLVTLGANTSTKLAITNPTEQWSAVGLIARPSTAKAKDGEVIHLSIMIKTKVFDQDRKLMWEDSSIGEAFSLSLPAKATLEVTLVAPLRACDIHGLGCISEADLSAPPTFGSAEVWYTSALPETLDALLAPIVTLTMGEMNVSGKKIPPFCRRFRQKSKGDRSSMVSLKKP
jgi:hypothetical protein